MSQEIKMHERFISAVLAGQKTTTLRRGIKPYTLGLARIVFSTGYPAVPVLIEKLEINSIKTLHEFDAVTDGFRSLGSLVVTLKEIYPGLSDYEDLTLVQFKRVTPDTKPNPLPIAAVGETWA